MERDKAVTYNNSNLSADNVTINSVADTSIEGGNVRANEALTANIGADLTVASRQNRSSGNSAGFGVSGGFSLGQAEGGEADKLKNEDGSVNATASINSAIHTNPLDNDALTGVNGGANTQNGRYSTTQTVVSSLTSGGAADITVGGNTHISGAVIATVDDDGNDLGQLNLSTRTLSYNDLTDRSSSSNTSAGFSTNVGIGDKQNENGTQDSIDENGSVVKVNSSQLNYSNSSSNDGSTALATLGLGNIIISDEANSDDTASLNRDVGNTTKELYSVEQSQEVSLTFDHRLLRDAKDYVLDVLEISSCEKAGTCRVLSEQLEHTSEDPEGFRELEYSDNTQELINNEEELHNSYTELADGTLLDNPERDAKTPQGMQEWIDEQGDPLFVALDIGDASVQNLGNENNGINQLINEGTQRVIAFGLEQAPEFTAASLAELATVSQATGATIEFLDTITGKVVSAKWNELSPEGQARIKGLVAVGSILPVARASRVAGVGADSNLNTNVPEAIPPKTARDEFTGPYDSNTARADLEATHGADNVTSTTNPNNPLQTVNSNPNKGIEVITDSYGNKAVRVKFDDPVTGVPTSANIPYNNRGLPVFDDHAKYTTNIDKTKSYDAQFSQATRDLRDGINSGKVDSSQFTANQLSDIKSGSKKIEDFTWHHNADSGNMQLIPTDVHKAVKHVGDKALSGGK
jgi:filamentous hemagglutinin